MIQKVQATGWVTNVLVLALSAVVIAGALKMKNLESYSLAMAASIIAMVPCFGPCCCFGLPVGIWSHPAQQARDQVRLPQLRRAAWGPALARRAPEAPLEETFIPLGMTTTPPSVTWKRRLSSSGS